MSIKTFLSLLLGMALAAAPAAAAERLAVLGVSAPQVDEMTSSFLDEAIAAAAVEALGEPVLDAVSLQDKLKPAQLRQAMRCDAPQCWRNLGEQLQVQFILSIRSMKTSSGLVLSARLVRVADGRILARAQRSVALDAGAFAEGARGLWQSLRDTAKLVEPGLFPAATAQAAPRATVSESAAAPALAAQSANADDSAGEQARETLVANKPIAATKPVTIGRVEQVPEVEEGFEYTAPTAANVQALLGETRPVGSLWNATWRPGLGFTLSAAGALPAGESAHVSRPLEVPPLLDGSLDGVQQRMNAVFYSLTPPEAVLELATLVGFDALFDIDWRKATSRVSSWMRWSIGIALGVGGEGLVAMDPRLGASFGVLLHALPGTRGRTLALGPYVGAAVRPFVSFASTTVLRPGSGESGSPSEQFSLFFDREYGLRLLACPAAEVGSSTPLFQVEADLYRVGALWTPHDEVEFGSAATFVRLAGELSLSEELRLRAGMALRLAVSEDWTYLTAAQLMSSHFQVGFTQLF